MRLKKKNFRVKSRRFGFTADGEETVVHILTETETVIKKILPYLRRRGYDIEKDLDFETALKSTERYSKGYCDIHVKPFPPEPGFLIEAKRAGKNLTDKDRKQALSYGRSLKVRFVVLTNGKDVECYNVSNQLPIKWNGELAAKIPTREQLKNVLKVLKIDAGATDVDLKLNGHADESLPFRPGLPLKQLNALFARCHNAIRKIEKDEQHAFSDFSKFLFLKLLEEKSDREELQLPYSSRFYELAELPDSKADQVRSLIKEMVSEVSKKDFGDVLADGMHAKKAQTYQTIVRELSRVSFQDCDLDSKGAAFEYFVRATLKGKQLGQYFTPRPLVSLMAAIVGREKIVNDLLASTKIKVVDPACGTGGFIVYLMNSAIEILRKRVASKQISEKTAAAIIEKLKKNVFFGADANPGVAAAAKMNLVIAGDGHTNITAEDSLSVAAKNWSTGSADCDYIFTNPPFGTSEAGALSKADFSQFDVQSTKGQNLFIQKMVLCANPETEGEICTVIDDGILNTDAAKSLRKFIFEKCRVKAVVSLPLTTFKPNKINVKSSVLYLSRREIDDTDLLDAYPVTFCEISSLGYQGSGEEIRGFDFEALVAEVDAGLRLNGSGTVRTGNHWRAFDVSTETIYQDGSYRLDAKYWDPAICKEIGALSAAGAPSISDINLIATRRGKSPSADTYVDREDGFAAVLKAGSSVDKFGNVGIDGDWVEKDVFDDLEAAHVQHGDILLSSTGDGTLGKCGVYRESVPALADGHITIIRVDQSRIWPEFLCDYLRVGPGAGQIVRYLTGSTGLVELPPEYVDRIRITIPENLADQREQSKRLRKSEAEYQQRLEKLSLSLSFAREAFVRDASLTQTLAAVANATEVLEET
ncbi:putative type I restriction enzymeP M protein [compost metagenome]